MQMICNCRQKAFWGLAAWSAGGFPPRWFSRCCFAACCRIVQGCTSLSIQTPTMSIMNAPLLCLRTGRWTWRMGLRFCRLQFSRGWWPAIHLKIPFLLQAITRFLQAALLQFLSLNSGPRRIQFHSFTLKMAHVIGNLQTAQSNKFRKFNPFPP